MSAPVVIGLACVAFLNGACAVAAEPSLQSILTVVQQSVPSATVATPSKDPATFFAGCFSTSPKVADEVGKPTAGDILYLLPDQTYCYLNWTDLSPWLSMVDKGHWRFDGQFIRTQSDHSIPRRTPFHDHAFSPLLAKITGAKSLYLLETSQDFPRLVKETKPRMQGNFPFLLFARARISSITDASAARAEILKQTGQASSPKIK